MSVPSSKLLLTVLLGLLASATAHAAVYECRQANGSVRYTNSPQAGCTSANIGRVSTYSSAAPTPGQYGNASPAPAQTAAPAANTRSSSALAAEQQALAQAQKNLAEGRAVRLGNERNYAKYQARIAALEAEVAKRQQAVNALQQQESAAPNH